MSDYTFRTVDPESPYAREMMARPLSDAADILALTTMMALHCDDVTSERMEELDRICEELIVEFADAMDSRAENAIEGHMIMGWVAVNLMASFMGHSQEAWDMAMLQSDLEEM